MTRAIQGGNVDVDSQPWIRGRYRVLHAVGAGGLGSVNYAWDEELQRAVAVKRLFQRGEKDCQALEEAWQEARTLAAIQNPHILTLFDFGADEQGPYFIMEFLEGETLDRALERGPLRLADALEMARQILEGLSAAHGKGILHLDLKPSNVMLQRSASGKLHTKILDFGLARFQQQIDVEGPPVGERGGVMGTVYYISPEHLEGGAVGARTDLYALGHVLYQSLAGRTAFTGDSIQEIVAQHLESEPAPIRNERPDVSPHVADWLHRLMSREAANRPADAMEALDQLRHLDAFHLTASRPVFTVPVEPAPKNRSGLWLWTAGVAVLVILAAGVAWKTWDSRNAGVVSLNRVEAPVPEERQNPTWVPPSLGPSPGDSAPLAPVASGTGQNRELTGGAFMDPADLAGLRGRLGQEVAVRGTIVDAGQNRDDSVRYLNFSANYVQSVGLVFFVSDQPQDFAAEKLSGYVGREVEVRGIVREYRDALQIRIRTLEQIRILRR